MIVPVFCYRYSGVDFLLRPVHKKNDNYKDNYINNYISVHTNGWQCSAYCTTVMSSAVLNA